jgi:hypothetical protein
MSLESLLVSGYAEQVPASVDYMTEIGTWPMYANDRLEDCTAAAAGHSEEVWSTYGQSSLVMVTEQAVIDLYSAGSGYNPANPSTDQGAVMQDMLDAWRKTGLGGHRITAFAEIDPQNKVACKAALYFFGTLYVGINFPKSADQQFLARQVWTYDSTADNEILGGHAIHVGAVSATGNWDCSTWGRRQTLTSAWWDAFVEEAWVPISLEWIKSGVTPVGIKVADANAAYTDLTKQPGPFPVDLPPSTPPSPPTPVPPATDPDVQLVQRAWPWVTSWHVKNSSADKAAQALKDWRTAKGL